MATTEQIAIELRVRNQQLANDLRKSTAEVKKLEKSFAELGNTSVRTEKQIRSVAKSTGLMANVTKAFVGIAVVGFLGSAAAAFSKYASAIQGANNQLRAATTTTEEYERISAGVLQIANQTGTSFESVANSAARFNRAVASLGGTVDQALLITDSLSKSLLISGASTVEATAALQQFGQALESGLLSGDEFRSLRENAPIAARAIADSLGVTLGELRKLSEQGKLTSDIVAKALIDGNKKISEQAGKIPLTLDRALTVASNGFKDFIADNTTLNEVLVILGEKLIEVSELLTDIAGDFSSAGEEVNVFAIGTTTAADAIKIVISALYLFGKAIKNVLDIIVGFGIAILNVFVKSFGALKEIVTNFAIYFEEVMIAVFQLDRGKVAAAVAKFQGSIGDSISGAAAAISAEFGVAVDGISTNLGELKEGIDTVWDSLVIGREAVKPLELDPDGALAKTAEDAAKADKEAKKLLDTFEKLAKALNDYRTSQATLPEQTQAQFAALVSQVNAYRDAAVKAGKEVDEALVSDVLVAGVKERDQALEDQARQWRDIVPPVNEAEAAARRYLDTVREIQKTGADLGKSPEEIEAAVQALNDALDNEELRKFREYWVDIGKTLIDTFGDAFQAVVSGSEDAKDALKGLLQQLLILIAKAAILKLLGGGSFMQNLGGLVSGQAPGAASGASAFGISPRASGSTVRIYNQSGGLVSTQTRSNGDVDVMIGALATAVSRGGNSFDAVMRRTYGLGRVGI